MNIACLTTVAAIGALVSFSVMAQVTDPSMTCEAYLKAEAAAGPTPSTGDAAMDKQVAELDKKIADYCKANPKATAMDASMKAMGG